MYNEDMTAVTDKISLKEKTHLAGKIIFFAAMIIGILGSWRYSCQLSRQLQSLQQKINQTLTGVNTSYDEITRNYRRISYESHLASLNAYAVNQAKNSIEEEYNKLKSEASGEKLTKIENIYSAYNDAVSKISRNSEEGLSTTEEENLIASWGEMFLNQELDKLLTQIEETKTELDQDYQDLLAQRAAEERARQLTQAAQPTAAPTATPLPSNLTKGYATLRVGTAQGTFTTYLVKYPRSEVRILTLAANANDCSNNCPTKSLQQYVNENNGFAGIHGSYFCPPDYSSCAQKVNSYDYSLFDTNRKKWLNSNALGWQNLGLITFNGTQANLTNFYTFDATYSPPAVTAGIENYPSLTANGKVIVNNFSLTSYQNQKGYRGAIGYDASNVYLAIVASATVPETAQVMKELGATHSLNLDGGGTSALYHNGYKVGPGRSLPNAIVLQKR